MCTRDSNGKAAAVAIDLENAHNRFNVLMDLLMQSLEWSQPNADLIDRRSAPGKYSDSGYAAWKRSGALLLISS